MMLMVACVCVPLPQPVHLTVDSGGPELKAHTHLPPPPTPPLIFYRLELTHPHSHEEGVELRRIRKLHRLLHICYTSGVQYAALYTGNIMKEEEKKYMLCTYVCLSS